MESTSKTIKNAIIDSLKDNTVYTNSDFKTMIYEKTGMRYGTGYQESHFAGCVTTLKKKGFIRQIERGKYQKVANYSTSASTPLENSEDLAVSETLTVTKAVNSFETKTVPESSNLPETENLPESLNLPETENLPKSLPSSEIKISISDAKEQILLSVREEIDYLKKITKNTFLSFDSAEKEYQNIQEINKLIQFLQNFTFQ